LISRSALMVLASFLLFVPMLMNQVYGTTSALAAQTGSIYAMGCWLSVTLLSPIIPNLARERKAALFASLVAAIVVCSITQLGRMLGWWPLSLGCSIITMFVWGFAVACPFYIPPAMYALETGGRTSSATIVDLFDIGGFGVLAAFNGYVGSIVHNDPAAWSTTFILTTACAIFSLISLPLALLLEASTKDNTK
jgi:hypothetical protein